MLIGGVSAYPAPAVSPLPARPSAQGRTETGRTPPSSGTAPQTPEDEPASAERSGNTPPDQNSQRQERLELLEIARLRQRDREVRAHEQAHAAVGGRYAGAPSFTYTNGPDGKRYAIGGEVSIDSGAIANDPQATISKMEVVIRAALAPAEPSAQDQRVAAQAQVTLSQARADLAQLRREASEAAREAQDPAAETPPQNRADGEAPRPASPDRAVPPGLDLYRRLSDAAPVSAGIDLLA